MRLLGQAAGPSQSLYLVFFILESTFNRHSQDACIPIESRLREKLISNTNIRHQANGFRIVLEALRYGRLQVSYHHVGLLTFNLPNPSYTHIG